MAAPPTTRAGKRVIDSSREKTARALSSIAARVVAARPWSVSLSPTSSLAPNDAPLMRPELRPPLPAPPLSGPI